MIITTTPSVEGYKIISYKGLISAVGVNTRKLSFSFNTEKFIQAMEESIDAVKQDAFNALEEKAKALNCNAIVGVSVDLETDPSTTFILVSVTGTAVNIV